MLLPSFCTWKTRLKTPCPALMPCAMCKQLLPSSDFLVFRKSGSNRTDALGQSRSSKCRKCVVDYAMQAPLERRLLQSAKARAKAKSLPFDIDISDIYVPETCPVLGIPLFETKGKGRCSMNDLDHSPSLDRIDNAKGYIKGNVRVISMRANNLKSNGTLEEFEAIVKYLRAETK